ncbi:hypothetical protein BDR03DRAFT_396144 [Suillus americanus]|nr:hypothetical protein BDR03DRAFT_396144 [Suillus americanus]
MLNEHAVTFFSQQRRWWNVYLNIPNEWVPGRDYSLSSNGPLISDNSDATSSDKLSKVVLVAPSLSTEEEIAPVKHHDCLLVWSDTRGLRQSRSCQQDGLS